MLNEQQLITASNETYLPNTSGLITAQRVRDFNNTDLIPTIFDISASLQNTINSITVGSGFVTTQSFNSYTSSQTAESASFNVRVNELETSETALNLYTQSINTYTQSMNQFTSSYTTGSFTGSFSGDGSKLYGITASGAGVGILDEGIFQGTAVTLNFTGSNISASVVAGIGIINVTPTDVSMFLSKSTFEAYTASLDTTFATDAQLSASASTLQDNINTLSSSVAVTDLAQSSSIAQLLGFSSSLDSTYATDAQLSASVSALSSSVTVTTNGLSSSIGSLSSSIAVTDLAQSASIAALQQFSSSLDSTFATDTQLSASASTLQDNINTLSSSVAVTTLGLSSSVAALQSFSSSLDSTYATDTQLSASASTLQNNINSLSSSVALTENTLLTTASFNSYTASASSDVSSSVSQSVSALSQSVAVTTLTINGKLGTGSFESYTSSNDAKVNSLIDKTGSFATTGSNTFNGSQSITGSVSLTGNITATSASFQYVQTIYETASVIFSSGSNQLGDELSDVQTLSGSVKVQGELLVNGIPVQTASFDASGYLLTSSFNAYTQSESSNVTSSINTAVAGLVTTASFNSYTSSESSNVSASINSATSSISASLTLTDNSKLNTGSFNTYTASVAIQIGALGTQLGTKLNTSSFNSYTSSNDGKVNSLIAATGSYITSAQTSSMTVLSASFAQTASFLLGSVASASFANTASFALTASEARNVVIIARNGNASSLPAGTIVHITSASGDNPIFNTASYDSEALSANTLGMLRTTATSGADVEVLVNGIVTGVNTDPANGFVAGDIIYLGPTGSFTRVQPQAPLQVVTIGQVLRAQQNNGSVYVTITNGWELNELHNVRITNPLDGQTLVYSSSLWINSSSAATIETGSFATTGSNTFKDTQTIDLSATSIITASAIIGNANAVITDMYVNGGNYDTFNVLVSASNGVFLRDFNGVDTTPFLSVDTNGGNVRIPRSTNITGSLNISASLGGDDGNIIRGGVTIVGDNLGNAIGVKSGSVAITSPQGTGFFYSNLPMTSSGLRINGTALVADLIVSGVFGGNSSVNVIGAVTASVVSASQYIGIIQSASFATTASFALNAGGVVDTGSFATTGSNLFKGDQTIQSGSLSGSLIDNLGDIYTGSNNAQHIVTLGSASMAFLISSSTTNPNTLYFVI